MVSAEQVQVLGAQIHCHDDRTPAESELAGVHHGVRFSSAALFDTALQRLAAPFEHKCVANTIQNDSCV
eukprot:1622312-Lingulodinium_polyedra.AAC.1